MTHPATTTSACTAATSPLATQTSAGLRPVMLTMAHWCAVSGLTRSASYELIKDGKLVSVLIAGRRLVPYSEAERLLAEALAAVPAKSGRAVSAATATAVSAIKRRKFKPIARK